MRGLHLHVAHDEIKLRMQRNLFVISQSLHTLQDAHVSVANKTNKIPFSGEANILVDEKN